MNAIQTFNFDGMNLRVFGDSFNPIFIAADVCKAIGIQNPSDAIKSLAPFERTKVSIDGRELNAVNESGLYTLILRSRDAVKEGTPAYRFRLMVTAEILPTIRKSGRYEPESPKYITPQQGWLIQAAVQKRVHRDGVDFQTVYQALKARYQIPKYTFLQEKDFEEALRFIDACEIRVPAKKAPPKIDHTFETPRLSHNDLEAILIFVYEIRYRSASAYNKFFEFLKIANSPMAAEVWDAFHEVNWTRIIDVLAANGHPIVDLPCYRSWRARNVS